jgi:hypothetical protein
MLRAFFDDSGKESDSGNRFVCIAGYIAIEGCWNMFTEGWNHQLLKHGMSSLHTKDFMVDKTIDWPTKRKILDGFINVIKASQLIGFGVALDADAWRELPPELTRAEGNAQQFCFLRIMRMLVKRFKAARENDFAILYFDCDKDFTPSRFQKFLALRDCDSDFKRYLKSFCIADPQWFLPLQAADLLAWQTRKDLIRRLDGHDTRPEFKYLFESLLNWVPDYESEMWDREGLENSLVKPFKEGKIRERGF